MAFGRWSAGATTLWLYYHTLRHLAPAQFANRATRQIRRMLPAPRLGRESGLAISSDLPDPFPGLNQALRSGPWSEELGAAIAAGADVVERRFTFLGRSERFEARPLPWNDPAYSQLWRYHLHYFDYVLDLAALAAADEGARSPAADTFAELATDWIAANPEAKGDGWHPYTVSRRLVNWLLAARHFGTERVGSSFDREFEESIARQARYLAKNLELDVRGNHLIANLRALLCAGLFLAGTEPQRWKEMAVRRLQLEIAEQVLPDGGHFERNPGYHLVVLRDLIDIASWWRLIDDIPPPWLLAAIERMLDYLAGVLPSTGELPLVKDTAWDQIPNPSGLLAAGGLLLGQDRWKRSRDDFSLYPALIFGEAGWERYQSLAAAPLPTSVAFAATGHYILRDDRRGDFLFFDAGEPCPPYLPAHAHADLLSYELTVGGRRLVVDSGVYEYTAGRWRNYFRSTRAHNTVEVAGRDQSEVWGSFRTARRAHPRDVQWKPEDERLLAAAAHDGYARLRPPVIHRRTIAWEKGRFWLILDRLLGAGSVAYASYVHLHSSLSLRRAGQLVWQVEGFPSPVWISVAEGVSAAIVRSKGEPPEQGWRSERFGELSPNSVLVLAGHQGLPATIAYAISLGEAVSLEYTDSSGRRLLRARHQEQVYEYPIDEASQRA